MRDIIHLRRRSGEIVILVGGLYTMTSDEQNNAVAGLGFGDGFIELARIVSRLAAASSRSDCEMISTDDPAFSCRVLAKRAASLAAKFSCRIRLSS